MRMTRGEIIDGLCFPALVIVYVLAGIVFGAIGIILASFLVWYALSGRSL